MTIYLTVLIISNVLILFSFNNLSKKFRIVDVGDGKRKFQKNPVSLLGGSLLFFNIFIFIFLDYFLFKKIIVSGFINTNRELFAFTGGIISLYLYGLFDDKYKLSANYKLLISTFFVLLFILLDENLIISNLEFSFLNHIIELKSFAIFFTLLCFLLFFNALNMFDGINCQVGFYCIFVFLIFFSKNIFPELCLILIISLLFFLILNYKGKVYLGESGVLLLAFIIGYIFIKSSNLDNKVFFADEIFMIMALPGMDMLRLFISRIYKGKHPFTSDMNHIHHLFLKHFSNTKTFIIILLYILITTMLYFYINFKLIYLIMYVTLYLSIIFLFLPTLLVV